MAVVMLSLVSNPFDPFDDFASWSEFDRKEGFDTAGFLARALSSSEELGEPDQEQDVEDAVDSILANPSFAGLYKKVVRGAA